MVARSLRVMAEDEKSVDHLLCEHRWVPAPEPGGHPTCDSCGLGYRDYVHGTVRAVLSRQGVWP